MQQLLSIDYTPTIQYITDSKSFSLNFDGTPILKSKYFDYKNLFTFINYDLNSLSIDLNNLYQNNFEDSLNAKKSLDKISIHLKNIFSISFFPATIAFIQTDYTEHIRHKLYFSSSTYEEKEILKTSYLTFLKNLYNITPDLEFENIYSSKYFEDLFTQHIVPTSQTNAPITELSPRNIPPYTLFSLQKKFRHYLNWNISKNEAYRLAQKNNRQTQLEYQNLIESALKKAKNECSFSEQIALGLYESEKSQKDLNITFTAHTQAKCPPPSIPPFPLVYEKNILIDFSYIPQNTNETAYTFDHLEAILMIDMFYFLRSKRYTFQCPKCNKIFNNNRASFYCSKSCKDAHRQHIINSCLPWKEIEKIRKKINARTKKGIYNQYHAQNILHEYKQILDLYLNKKIDTSTAMKEISKLNEIIKSEYQKIKNNKIYGLSSTNES